MRISHDMGISPESLGAGGGSAAVSRARAALSYVWVRYLGRSGVELARELGVNAQAVYVSSGRVDRELEINSADLERWCRCPP